MSFSKNDLENIKSKISIRTEFEKKTKLVQKGKDYWCCCLFHEEKTPSCKINEDQTSFYCFGCGAKGDIFTLYTDLYNYSFVDAVKELSQQAGVQINFDSIKKSKQENLVEDILKSTCKWFQENLNTLDAKMCNQYLENRKLTKETIEKFRLGYSYNSNSTLYKYLKSQSFTDEDLLQSNIVKLDKNKKIRDYFYKRLIFPITNIHGHIVGFGGRALDESNPKYINSPESEIFKKRYLLYNLDNAKITARKKNNLLICEGYMDVITLHQNGIFSVVAPLGTALTEDQLKLSWKYSSKPTIMFDGDSPGIRASYKTAIMALPLISAKNFLQFVTLPQDYDPDSYINKVSFKKFLLELKNPESLIEFIFYQSSKSVSLDKVDEKISYDKYLDDLVKTIKDKKTQYFYKNEFKSLFFNKIRKIKNISPTKNILIKKIDTNLNKKQNLSFIATAINHLSIRKKILDDLETSDLFNENELELISELKKYEVIHLEKDKVLSKLPKVQHVELIKEALSPHISKLFPYSLPSFNPQQSYKEVKESLNNLNTRLSYLKKINKSLDTFINESNSLNWSELQNINIEILDED